MIPKKAEAKAPAAASKPSAKHTSKPAQQACRLPSAYTASTSTHKPQRPPTVDNLQLKMFHAVLKRRRDQLNQLSKFYFDSYANSIIVYLNRTMEVENQYSDLSKFQEKENSEGGAANGQKRKIDLTKGANSSFLIMQHPPPPDITVEKVVLHLVALFYRSVDERLPGAMRKHSLDALNYAFNDLDKWVVKNREWEEMNGKSDKTKVIPSRSDGGTKKRRSTESDGTSEKKNGGSSDRRMRKDPPEWNGAKQSARKVTASPGKTFLPPHNQMEDNNDDDDEPLMSLESNKKSSKLGGSDDDDDDELLISVKYTNGSSSNPKATGVARAPVIERPGKTFLPPQPQPNNNEEMRADHKGVQKNSRETSALATSGVSQSAGISQRPGKTFLPPHTEANDVEPKQAAKRSSVEPPPKPSNGSLRAVSSNPPLVTGNAAQSASASATLPSATPQNQSLPSVGGETSNNIAKSDLASSGVHSTNNTRVAVPSTNHSNVTTGTAEAPTTSTQQHKNANQSTAATQPKQPTPASVNRGVSQVSTSRTTVSVSIQQQQATAQSKLPSPSAVQTSKPASSAPVAAPKVGDRPTALNKKNDAPVIDANKSTGKDAGVIDLTDDSPPSSPLLRPATLVPSVAVKQLADETPAVKSPSPPPSPPPTTTILNRLPPALPTPKPFTKMSKITFRADDIKPYSSGSVDNPRRTCAYSYDVGFHLDGIGACLDDKSCNDFRERLQTWDPYWRVVEELGKRIVSTEMGQTKVGTRTTSCQAAIASVNVDYVNSCTSVFVDLPKEIRDSSSAKRDPNGRELMYGVGPWGVKWGQKNDPDSLNSLKDNYITGDRRLIVRMLPLQRNAEDEKKRADTHLWPIGTFVQLKIGGGGFGNPIEKVVQISQRKQESHAHDLWKGMALPLDLTKEIINTNFPFTLQLCCREVVENNNEGMSGSFGIQVAVCEYVGANRLYDELMGKVDGGDVRIPTLSLRSAKQLAKKYVVDQMVSIEESDDEDDDKSPDDKSNSLTFSLICAISKTPMKTPVRGRHCKHLQCFDLRNWLSTNENVAGGRFRCGACENFLSVRDLIHCGLFQAMLDTHRDEVSGLRDKVCLRPDGTYYLKDENKLRYANKKKALTSTVDLDSDDDRAGRAMAKEPEVIDLD